MNSIQQVLFFNKIYRRTELNSTRVYKINAALKMSNLEWKQQKHYIIQIIYNVSAVSNLGMETYVYVCIPRYRIFFKKKIKTYTSNAATLPPKSSAAARVSHSLRHTIYNSQKVNFLNIWAQTSSKLQRVKAKKQF